jgi:hypothetical protein
MQTRRRIADSQLLFYEDAIARQVRIVRLTQKLASLLDVSTLEEVEPFIADIIAAAGATRRGLIAAMNDDKDESG